jgi:PAS domain S-box-containing protein
MLQDLRDRLADISTEAKRLARGRTENLAVLERLLDGLPVAALVADDDGHYVIGNQAAAALTGYTTHALSRLSVWELTPNINESEAALLWRAFLARQKDDGEYVLLVNGGRVVRVAYAAQANVVPGLHVSLLQPIA